MYLKDTQLDKLKNHNYQFLFVSTHEHVLLVALPLTDPEARLGRQETCHNPIKAQINWTTLHFSTEPKFLVLQGKMFHSAVGCKIKPQRG